MADKPFDVALKHLVEADPGEWPALLRRPRAPVTVVDADIATVSGAADKVLRVEAREPYLLHLDFVAGHDAAALPLKLNVRNTLLEYRHGLPVLSVAVLLRPEADSPALTGERRRALSGEEPYNHFRYEVVRVWRLDAEQLLTGGLGTLPLAPIANVTEAQLPGIIGRMEQRLGSRRLRRHADTVWSATFILMGLRYSSGLAAQLLRGVVSMKESTTYQMILEEGAIAEAKKLLLLQGTSRFGAPDGRTATALEGVNQLSDLEELGVRLLRVRSWQELLKAEKAPARRSRRR
jgi:predicted transposase YdaD